MTNNNNIIVPDGVTWVSYHEIEELERSRIDYGDLEGLAESIRTLGLIHPPLVSKNKDTGKVTLVAGGRRLTALKMLELVDIPVLFREDLDSAEIAQLEAEENIRRLNMKWHEKVLNISRIHELRKDDSVKKGESWGMRETGALFGTTAASVSHCHQLKPYILSEDKEILASPSIKAAYDILLKRKEDEAVKLSAQTNLQASKVTDGFVPEMDLEAILNNRPADPLNKKQDLVMDSLDDIIGSSPVEGTIFEKQEFELSKMLFFGDCLEIMPKLKQGSVDHIVTDPPYGIPIENMDRINNLDTVAATHGVADNLEMLPKFIEASYSLLKENGFMVMWYDLDHHEKIQSWAKDVGFQVQRWPLIWQKLHRCMNNAATKNFTKDYEVAMVLRKGKIGLYKPQSTSIIAADNSAERKLYDNPFAKPSKIWHFIYEAIAFKGQVVFDPFMGQGSATRAAIDLGLTPMGIEIDENHFNRAVVNVKNKINEITGNRAVFK